MKRKVCINCQETIIKGAKLDFQDMLGKWYQAYFCNKCNKKFNLVIAQSKPSIIAQYFQDIAETIEKNMRGVPAPVKFKV